MVSEVAYSALLLATGAERLVELRLSTQHAAWAFAQGGKEFGASHYPFMVMLHSGLLVGAGCEVWWLDRPFMKVGWLWLGLAVAAQALRWWCIGTLGQRWNTRVIVLPGRIRIGTGPYRWLPHPNYVAVMVEGVALPMVHMAYLTASIFTLLNLALLRVRVGCENQALQWAEEHA